MAAGIAAAVTPISGATRSVLSSCARVFDEDRTRRGAERPGHTRGAPRVGVVQVLSLLAAVAAFPEPNRDVAVMTRRHTRSRLVDQEPCKLIYHGEPHCPPDAHDRRALSVRWIESRPPVVRG